LYIGVDLGGTNIGIGIIDDNGKIIAETSASTRNERPFNEIAEEILNLIKELISKNNFSSINALGFGLPGTVDVENGIFVSAPNIKVYKFNLKKFFESELGIPTFVDNDANCAALAEAMFGATKDFNNSITITLGTGIGSGIIINKRILRGLGNCAGEIGHMVIVKNGIQCGCGRKGCWEQYASTRFLNRLTIEAANNNKDSIINKLSNGDLEKVNSKLAFEAAAKGDAVAIKVLDEYFNNLSEGLANIINIISPEAIAIGGSISKQGERLLEPIRNFIRNNTQCKGIKTPEILTARFGREAGIVGAAMLGTKIDW
jgi:glucokinase